MLFITHAEYIEGYSITLTFSDGSQRVVDLANELFGEVFEPLKDVALFKDFCVNHDTGTIEWSNGADFAPEFLFEKSVKAELVISH